MTDSGIFESAVAAFEQGWKSGVPPAIAAYLPSCNELGRSRYLELLCELVCIDLELRWKAPMIGNPPTLEVYVRDFTDLGLLDDLPADLIGEEYRVRQQWGDRPARNAFLSRFPHRANQMAPLLDRIDDELQDERHGALANSGIGSIQPPRRDSLIESQSGSSLAYGDYVLQRLIGAGSTGKVYRAWQRSCRRPVAVKYLRKSFITNPGVVARFMTEARIVAGLRHPGIIPVHGSGRTPGGGYFIAMDLIDGPDLAKIVRAGPIDLKDAVRWTAEACEAIDHAHTMGIIHCDLKPGNLLLGPNRHIRVTDFGLACRLDETTTDIHRIAGTAAFMAPEQVFSGWGPINPTTDVYGLGGVLYTLMTGSTPHCGSTFTEILAHVTSAVAVIPPRKIRPEISETLEKLCLRCLSKSPSERFGTASALSSALSEFV